MTRSLETRGFVTRRPDPRDGRKSLFDLTFSGREALSDLEGRARAVARELLAPLSEAGRVALIRALETVERVLNPAARPTVVLRPPRPGDWGWIIFRHGALCVEEHGWNAAFERFVARVTLDFVESRHPERETRLIAEVDGVNAGSIAVARGDDDLTAKPRLPLVEPSARGPGIGGRLVDEAPGFARRVGCRRMTLWTMEELGAARRICGRAGFTINSRGINNDFGREMVEEVWGRSL